MCRAIVRRELDLVALAFGGCQRTQDTLIFPDITVVVNGRLKFTRQRTATGQRQRLLQRAPAGGSCRNQALHEEVFHKGGAP